MTSGHIQTIARDVLRKWSLWAEEDQVTVHPLPSNEKYFIGYYSAGRFQLLSLNVMFDKSILYLLEIELPEFLHGQGHGSALYDRVVELGRRLGMNQVRQTPSGWTHSMESREDWLVRRGWVVDGLEVYKRLEIW